MGRWQPDARGRLARAALELYVERGFDRTSVAEIAERAGLTERTFFRHYADKREVLFAGSGELLDVLANAVAQAPGSATAMDAVAVALEGAAAVLAERQEHARHRQSVIDANTELQERELIKLASMSTALADALRLRGVDEPSAALAAEVGMAVFKCAFRRWVDQTGTKEFAQFIREALADLRAVTAEK